MAQKTKTAITLDETIIRRVTELEAEFKAQTADSKEIAALKNGTVMQIYCNVIAELARHPEKKSDRRPTASVGEQLMSALQEKCGMEASTAKRYWDNSSAAIGRMRKDGELPTQATASAVAGVFETKEIQTQADLRKWAHRIVEETDPIKKVIAACLDKALGTENAKTKDRHPKFDNAELDKLFDQLKIRMSHEINEIKIARHARETAKAENRKVEEVLAELRATKDAAQ